MLTTFWFEHSFRCPFASILAILGYQKWHFGCPNQNSKTSFQYKLGDLLRSVPWPIFEKNSEFILCDVYSYVFHWLLGSMWWKNTFPSSAIFSLDFLPIFTCLVSGHDNWHFLRIIWSGHLEKIKSPFSISIFITENKKP